MSKNKDFFLRWNSPIRKYSSLEVLRLLKYFPWIFKGNISYLDVLINYTDIFDTK